MLVNSKRITNLNSKPLRTGPVVYWMNREQRVRDNWGLLHARELAGQGQPLVVFFGLPPTYLDATLRHYSFMLSGLQEVENELKALGIPFVIESGKPEVTLVRLCHEIKAGAVVTDFNPIRVVRQWQTTVAQSLDVSVCEVDGHNVVPARLVSLKQEYAARTIRPKIHRNSHEFLEEFPPLKPVMAQVGSLPTNDWSALFDSLTCDTSVSEVATPSGERAALTALKSFINDRLPGYAIHRNNPNLEGTSRLSAYFHFGQLAPQRAALDVAATGKGEDQAVFLEELIIRRELSDNFCLFNPQYDSLQGAAPWALGTLDAHRADRRPYLYSLHEFEHAQTHSALWNAAQSQLRKTGFMHGYMRMFWAKKILEWSVSPEEAFTIALSLNDRYQLDGCDPNGYVGVLWSIAGLHDRGWKKRSIYGSIRYMNENGCRRKFDVVSYCRKWL